MLLCFCGLQGAPDDAPWTDGAAPSTFRLAVGFALAVLSQVLCYSVLPLAGAMIAPRPVLATLPFAALLLGSAFATFPASMLRDRFGRRAAFTLGASLGVAGGLIAFWAIMAQQLAMLVLGSLWLGIAQGFGLFYRHETASLQDAKANLPIVLGAGALAGFVAPTLIRTTEWLATPHVFSGTLLAAAAAHVGAVALAPGRGGNAAEPVPHPTGPRGSIFLATAVGAFAWFVMAKLMAHVPLYLSACGSSLSGISGLVAWHMVAMYAPSLAAGRLAGAIGPGGCAALGVLTVAGSAIVSTNPSLQAVALVMGGVGWSLSTLGATLLQSSGGARRSALALHDAALFAASFAGSVI
jgi:hypothetical protein